MKSNEIREESNPMNSKNRELSADELDSVVGGEVIRTYTVTRPQTMSELYQGWADLGTFLKEDFAAIEARRSAAE
jgi:hypothetical protein